MENKPYGADMKPFTSYEAIVEAVGNDASGIGYSSLELLTKPSVKAVSIGGIAPTAAAVNQGQYPMRACCIFSPTRRRNHPQPRFHSVRPIFRWAAGPQSNGFRASFLNWHRHSVATGRQVVALNRAFTGILDDPQ